MRGVFALYCSASAFEVPTLARVCPPGDKSFGDKSLGAHYAHHRGDGLRAALSGDVAPPVLTGAQKRVLRATAGRRAAAKELSYVLVSNVDSSTAEVVTALRAHELVRCKFASASKKKEAEAYAIELAAQTSSAVAQVIGHTALLYKPRPKGQGIDLEPRAES